MYGTFTFSYQPPKDATSEDTRVEMSFSSEADMPTILKHFGSFLRANGYPLDFEDSLEISRASEQASDPEINTPCYISDSVQSVEYIPDWNSVYFDSMAN